MGLVLADPLDLMPMLAGQLAAAAGPVMNGGGFFLIVGQSNAVGFGDDGAHGSGNTPGLTGADTRLLRNNLDANIKFAQDWQAAGSNPLSMISVATEALQPYAAAGGNNTGIAQGLGRALKRYGITTPHIIVCGVGSTQLPVNWAPSSNYPASGEKLYAHLVSFVNARKAEYGLPLDGIIQVGFESDSEAAGAPSSGPCATVAADMTAFYAQLRSDIGQASCPVWVCMPSDDWGTPANTSAYKSRVISWAAGDGHARTFDLTPFPIALAKGGNFPHCLAYGYEAFGHCLAAEMMRTYWQAGTFDPDGGVTAPHALWMPMGYTAQAGTLPSSSIPMGHPDPKVGDIDVLVAQGSPGTHAVSLDVAAGFTTQLIAQTDSVLTTSHRSITVWIRTVTQVMLDARAAGADGVKRGPIAIPSISFGAGTINVCQIITIRGSSGVGNFTTGANNAATTSLTIPSGGGAALSTSAPNSLLLIIPLCNGLTNQVASITNAALSNITVQRDSQYNTGTSTLNFAWATATKAAAGAVGNTVIQFGATTSVNVGAMIEFKA